MPELNDKFFKSLKTLQPLMEEYNQKLIAAFEGYLRDPSQDKLMPVFELQKNRIASASENSYGHINMIFTICDIAIKELGINLTPITQGTTTYEDAINKYHKTVFMVRRHIFMNNESDTPLLDEASDYILSENISAVALSYIINNEPGEPANDAASYWADFFRIVGRERDADILIGIQRSGRNNERA